MSLKAKIEAIIYAAEEPVTLAQLATLLSAELAELAASERPLAEASASADDNTEAAFASSDNQLFDSAQSAVSGGSATPSAGEPQSIDPELAAASPADSPETPPVEESAAPAETAPVPSPVDDEAAAKKSARDQERRLRDLLRREVDALVADYAASGRGMEIREVAGGYRMGTKPEYHDTVRSFVKSLKPPMKLSLQALETLAVVAYKQPVTAPEISEIRGVDSGGVLGGLLSRKLITTAGRKQVIGRPILYKTTREFLLRFGLKDINELPSMEEFEKMAGELAEQDGLPLGEGEQGAADASSQAMTSEAPVLDEYIEDGSAEIVEQAASHELHSDQARAEEPAEPAESSENA
ncbi:MAG: SMC-Scp complex subunit ScpB [Acidobacteriaceae bacterium]